MRRQIQRHRRKVTAAAKLYANFRGEEPAYIEAVKLPVAPVMMLIGECDGLLYTTRRDGHIEHYQHKFAKNSRPLLACSFDGSQLYLLGGAYDFTELGIVDKR